MSYSQVNISNLALATLGEQAIRSFDEDNTRARMCDTFFRPTRDYLLAKFDWPFARQYAVLSEVAVSEANRIPDRYYYGIPDDCRTPRDLHPRSGRNNWEVQGDFLITMQPAVGLHYTIQEVLTNRFSDGFSNLLALGMAVRMAPVLTKDRAVTKALYEQYKIEQVDTWEAEANIGNEYRYPDNDPNLDTFSNAVWPRGLVDSNGRI